MKNESVRKVVHVDKINRNPLWNFRQEDDGVLKLKLYQGLTELDIEGQTFIFSIVRPDNTIVTIDAQENFLAFMNNLDITLTTNCFTVSGTLNCDLEIIDSSGAMTTMTFSINVNEKLITYETIKGTDELSILRSIKEAETVRETNELIRIANENDRLESESDRVEAEIARVEAETARVKAETNREASYVQKETDRDESYTSAEAERNRIFNLEEDKRMANEEIREANELTRVTNEHDRVESENTRIESENDRASAESERIKKEAARVTAENLRVKAEEDRVQQEADREDNYIQKEADRDDAYEEAEEVRNDTFNSEEAERQKSEDKRAEEFAEMKAELDANIAILEQVQVNTDDIVELKDELINYTNVTYSEIDLLRTDINGVKHSNAGIAKSKTEEYLLDRINDTTYVNYEDDSIFATETYLGCVQDIKIKGKTLVDTSQENKTLQSTGEAECKYGTYPIEIETHSKNLINLGDLHTTPDITVDESTNSITVDGTEGSYNDIQFYVYMEQGSHYVFSRDGFSSVIGQILRGRATYYNANLLIQDIPNITTPFEYVGESGIHTLHVPSWRGTVKNIQLEKIPTTQTTSSEYHPYATDKTTVLSPCPLHEGNWIDLDAGKIYENVKRVSFDGSEPWELQSINSNGIANFKLLFTHKTGLSKCNKYNETYSPILDTTDKGYRLVNHDFGAELYIRELATVCSTVKQFKDMLAQWKVDGFPLELQYELVTPIVHEIPKTTLRSYEGTTHINTTSIIKPTISCKIPSDTAQMISNLQMQNADLQHQNDELQATQEEQYLDTLEMSLDQDIRMTMIEMGVY